ncbi:MAG: 5-oxoprolinase subunit PxpB [Beijerinckiaceae bacterium]
MNVRFLPSGDTALVVEFGDHIERALSERVLRLAQRLKDAKLEGIVETVPTFRSLLVHYDPLVTSGAVLEAAIAGHLEDAGAERQPMRLWHIPVCYESRFAPDLDEVAERTKLSTQEVIARHSGTQYLVYVVGFAAAFPYMGDLPPELVLPRRADPRVRVPGGSVAMATTLTGIYPLDIPGGWHLIGATPISVFNPSWERPALLKPGDGARFEPVSYAEYERVREAVARNDFTVPSTMVET